MKLNIGCGSRRIEGYTGVDAIERPAADIIAHANKIPLGDGVVEEVMAIHLFEHFYRWECDAVLQEWHRLLIPGGRLILELPNLLKCCHNVIADMGTLRGGKDPDQLTLWGLYGDPRQSDAFMSHKWGWTPKTLRAILLENGFIDVEEGVTQFHPVGRTQRDMRMTARRA